MFEVNQTMQEFFKTREYAKSADMVKSRIYSFCFGSMYILYDEYTILSEGIEEKENRKRDIEHSSCHKIMYRSKDHNTHTSSEWFVEFLAYQISDIHESRRAKCENEHQQQ